MKRDFTCPFCGHRKTIDFTIDTPFDSMERTAVKDIIRTVCHIKGFTPEDLLANTRKKHIVWARQLCYFFAYYCTDIPLTDIGIEVADGADHTTVLYGKNVVLNYINLNYQDVINDVEVIRYKMLNEGFAIPPLSEMSEKYYRKPTFKYIYQQSA